MTRPTRPLIVLAALALIEGLMLLAYSVFDLVEVLRLGVTGPAEVSNLPAVVLQILLFAGFGLSMTWIARGWWMARHWARSPFILAQLIALVVCVPLTQADGGGERVIGIVISMGAVLGIVLAFTPAVNRALPD